MSNTYFIYLILVGICGCVTLTLPVVIIMHCSAYREYKSLVNYMTGKRGKDNEIKRLSELLEEQDNELNRIDNENN